MQHCQDTGTGRPRRVGPFDIPASRYGVRVQGADEIALTKLDVLSSMKEIPVITGYTLDGKEVPRFDPLSDLDRVQPVMDKSDLLAMQQQVDEVYMSDEIRRYIVELSRATRRDSRLTLGLSPRASLAVAGMARAAAFLGGRNYVAPQDITAIFADAARHRLCLTEQARTGGDTVQNILDDVLHTVPRPRPEKPFHGR